MIKSYHGVPMIHAQPINEGCELEPTTALEAVKRWLHSVARLLILAGPVGTGKSLAAAWGVDEFIRLNATRDPWGKIRGPEGTLWVSAPSLIRLAPWSDEVVDLHKSPILVVDDLAEEFADEKTRAIIASLICDRDAHGYRTIITTNLNGKDFQRRYGTRIIDRLREGELEDDHAKWWIPCNGDSLRGRVHPKTAARPIPLRTEDRKPDLPPPEEGWDTGVDIDAMADSFLEKIKP